MDLDLKVVSKEINEILWRNHKTLSASTLKSSKNKLPCARKWLAKW